MKKAKKRYDYPADWRPMSGWDRAILRGILIAVCAVFGAIMLLPLIF